MNVVLLLLWSSLVSIAFAVVALLAPTAANALVVGFVAALVVPALIHLRSRDASHR